MSPSADDPLSASTIAAGLLKDYAGDRQMFLDLLARHLEEAVPEQLTVKRGGGLFARSRPIQAIEVDLGDDRFALTVGPRGTLAATRTRVSRGIALRTEELDVEAWLNQLASALHEFAQTHAGAMDALRRRLW
jgi:hypothetical protein